MMKLSFCSVFRVSSILLGLAAALQCDRVFAQRPLGADVSGYQPANINWTPATNAGVKFAWSKATEGTGYINPNFAGQVAGAVAAKVYIGAYHYARPGLHPNITGANSADSEAQYFWNTAGPYIKNGGQYFMPMLDWEDVGTSGQPATAPYVTNGFTTAQMSAWVNEWCTWVSNTAYASGVIVNPVVYSGTWYSVPGSTWPGLDSSVTYHPNDMSTYPTTPNPQTGSPGTSPWTTWTFWQYADTNWTGGDSDVYNGTLAGLVKNFVIGGTNAPSFTLAPTNITVTPGSSITFYAKVAGQSPMSMKWLFNGALIGGATSSNLSLANIQVSQEGAYALVLSNSYASVTNIAYLTVLTNARNAIVAPSGLVDWWPADGTPVDIVGGKSGTANGGITYAAGNPGRALHFDGSTSYLTTGAGNVAVPWTACFWVNRANAPGTAAALSGDGNYELKLEQYSNGTNTHQVGFTIFGVNDYNFGYTVPLNTWTHIAFVATGTGGSAQMQLYANGSLVGTITTNITCPRAYFGAGYVNSNGHIVDYMLGSLDEIMIFSRALTSAEINNLYAAGANGVVRAPEITGVQRVSPTQVQLSLRGLTGRNFTVYTSQDFLSWSSLGSVANPNGSLQFVESSATNDFKLYRAAQP
jgi:GH25 family lysozyme M1 (1,4-beta-N-acetylmuramidase)